MLQHMYHSNEEQRAELMKILKEVFNDGKRGETQVDMVFKHLK